MTYQNPHRAGCPWHSITESQGAPNIKWCEETLCQWISEPANTWSNSGYLAVGILITYLSFRKDESFALKQFGPLVFFMGAMSFFYHQSNFYGSQVLDFFGMFLFVGWVSGMNLVRLRQLSEKSLIPFNLTFSIFFVILLHIMYQTGLKFQLLILLAGFFILFTEQRAQKFKRTNVQWFLFSVLILVTALAFSLADGTRVWCDPSQHGLFSQGHALWHWLAATAMFTIYKHYSLQSERSL